MTFTQVFNLSKKYFSHILVVFLTIFLLRNEYVQTVNFDAGLMVVEIKTAGVDTVTEDLLERVEYLEKLYAGFPPKSHTTFQDYWGNSCGTYSYVMED